MYGKGKNKEMVYERQTFTETDSEENGLFSIQGKILDEGVRNQCKDIQRSTESKRAESLEAQNKETQRKDIQGNEKVLGKESESGNERQTNVGENKEKNKRCPNNNGAKQEFQGVQETGKAVVRWNMFNMQIRQRNLCASQERKPLRQQPREFGVVMS